MSGKIKNLPNKYSLLILFFIFFLGSALRLYHLGDTPVGFHRDEAFLGYNAFSILETGKDITGDFLPLHLKSFLYSPAGYSYFSIPFIAIFGLNEFSVRLASAWFGSLTIFLLFFVVNQLFHFYKYKNELGLISSLFFAISPWHINLSRVATENVIVVFFLLLGVLLYFHYYEKKRVIFLIVSILAFAVTLFIYQAPRAFLPLFLPLLFLLFTPKQYKKNFILSLLLFFITIVLPVLVILSSHDLSQRMRMLSIFQHPETQLSLDEKLREDGSLYQNILMTRVFDNKAISYSTTLYKNYFDHLSFNFLFTDAGLPDRYRVPHMGLLYIFELPLLLFGIWRLFIFHKRIAVFLVGWVLIAPIGSALTFDDIPNLQRTLLMAPSLAIISSFGLLEFWKILGAIKFNWLIKGVIVLIVSYSFFYYLHHYYVHQTLHRPWFRQEGAKQLVAKVNDLKSQYKKIVITTAESSPAIFFLFYNHYNPSLIQGKLSNMNDNYGKVNFDNYEFVDENCPLKQKTMSDTITGKIVEGLTGEENVLYVNFLECKHDDTKIRTVDKIRRSDNTVVFYLDTLQ